VVIASESGDDIRSILGARPKPGRGRHGLRIHRRRDGRPVDVALAITPFEGSEGQPGGVTIVAEDLADPSIRTRVLGPFAARLDEQAAEPDRPEDSVTGAVSRRTLVDRLEHAISGAARLGRVVAVVFLNVDRFKGVNDTFGHAAGDELLDRVATDLVAAIRPGDTLARLSGDEFVVLCDGIATTDDVIRIAERLLDCFASPFEVAEYQVNLTASIGLAIGVQGATADGVLRDADAAMTRAKERGRARYELHDEAMRPGLDAQRRVSTELQGALGRDEFSLRYQPIVSLIDGSILGFEALVRWDHPSRGMLGPAMFIPLAEESGLIVSLGRWVLETACADAARWNARRPGLRPLDMHVNLSPRQLTDPSLVDFLAALLERSSLTPRQLTLEITETALLKGDVVETQRTTALKALGTRLSLDDFGTGYSSLGHLQRFPLDGLKLDRSFVAVLGTDPRATTIVTSVIRMAHALDLDVVAEGIETRAQLVLCSGWDARRRRATSSPGP
jgi:diguanylate cyclase (GGDEF)-like protein